MNFYFIFYFLRNTFVINMYNALFITYSMSTSSDRETTSICNRRERAIIDVLFLFFCHRPTLLTYYYFARFMHRYKTQNFRRPVAVESPTTLAVKRRPPPYRIRPSLTRNVSDMNRMVIYYKIISLYDVQSVLQKSTNV